MKKLKPTKTSESTRGAVLKDDVFTLAEPGSAEERHYLEHAEQALRAHRAKQAREKPK